MISSFIITFREALEIALVVGIILGYLSRTKQTRYNKIVYLGISAGIVASILIALMFNLLLGGFSGAAEQIFEGTTMLAAALLLTTMILWMMRKKNVAEEIKHKVEAEVEESHKLGLFFLVLLSVLREGVETVIFLEAASFASTDQNIIGALGGIIAAIILGYIIFVSSLKINIKTFFNITSILLILLAAGFVAQGVHEFEEAGIIPPIVEDVWDINPAQNPDGSYPALHEKGSAGRLLRSLFGYTGSPSLAQLLSYLAYITTVLLLLIRMKKKD